MRQKWLRVLFRRRLSVAILILLQIAFVVYTIWASDTQYEIFNRTLSIFSLYIVLYIINKKDKPSYKYPWILLILIVPVFGGLFYLLFNFQSSTRKFRNKLKVMSEKTKPLLKQENEILVHLENESPDFLPSAKYLITEDYPIYQNTTCVYLSPGEVKFARLVEELKKAEHFIFLEYFIIQGGIMWGTILEVLKEKAKLGLDVRVLYDDMGCFFTLPVGYKKKLESFGIKTEIFNKFKPVLSSIQNNRDHRKIVVIDGITAFTGGINLADEYINVVSKHGYWKDASIMLRGEAVWSFTLIFLEMWNAIRNTDEDFTKFETHTYTNEEFESNGYVQPYADSPLDKENIGENVLLNIIINSKKYIYITTPYLIIDDTIISALILAAKGGVDVRIVTPFIGDNKIIHATTRSYYAELIRSGVKIYEYTKGFIHAKVLVSDDKTASIGTINLDYRSLYLHFECGVLLHKNDAIIAMKHDCVDIMNDCKNITLENCKVGPLKRLINEILRVFAPLM
ncbi:MAG: cls [Haloplasmataceae bacterium]|jgi:cardiolipin synthase|nr:cls [Haloplasmataceae bacterium]